MTGLGVMSLADDILLRPLPEPHYVPGPSMLEDIAIAGTLPRVKHAGWSDEAVATYVRDKLPRLLVEASGRGKARAEWISDRICSGILNESFGP